jgi:hypothetical protein
MGFCIAETAIWIEGLVGSHSLIRSESLAA